MREFEYIKCFIKNFDKSNSQINHPFESDAEILDINGKLYGITIDEFSPEEDLFDENDLFKLGQNLAICTLSDLFATGCDPKFYMHSIVTAGNDLEFSLGISEGIQNVLSQCNCFMIGGDCGQSSNWRYTGVAIGEIPNNQPITRILPNKEQRLWITGTLGDENLSALTGGSTPAFELRLAEATKIKECGLSCIDTSGGFMESIWLLHELNQGMDFHLIPDSIPYDESVLKYSKSSNIPKEAFLFGGAGEYELLFTTDTNVEIENATKVGTVIPSEQATIFWNERELTSPPPDAREFESRDFYIQNILEVAKQCM